MTALAGVNGPDDLVKAGDGTLDLSGIDNSSSTAGLEGDLVIQGGFVAAIAGEQLGQPGKFGPDLRRWRIAGDGRFHDLCRQGDRGLPGRGHVRHERLIRWRSMPPLVHTIPTARQAASSSWTAAPPAAACLFLTGDNIYQGGTHHRQRHAGNRFRRGAGRRRTARVHRAGHACRPPPT